MHVILQGITFTNVTKRLLFELFYKVWPRALTAVEEIVPLELFSDVPDQFPRGRKVNQLYKYFLEIYLQK